jgi:cytosine deaminase
MPSRWAPCRATSPPGPREHGVEVFAGSDNIRDAWSPFGNGDMLDRAMMIGYRANFRHDPDLEFVFDLVTAAGERVLDLEDYGLKVGGPADLVVVEAATIAEAVATRPRRKMVIKAGRIVAQDGVLALP